MSTLSFRFYRNNGPDLSAPLLIQAEIGGTAVLDYDYFITGATLAPNSTNILDIVIPANSDHQRVICTSVDGLVQPSATVMVTIVPDPIDLEVDVERPSAIGTLTFVSDGGGGYGGGYGP